MKPLTVTHGVTHEGKPLSTVDGLPGDYAELRPCQLRALAQVLLQIADDSENLPIHKKRGRRVEMTYRINGREPLLTVSQALAILKPYGVLKASE